MAPEANAPVTVVDVSIPDVLAHVDGVVARAGLTTERFVALGEADELDGELRDLWLMLGPVIRGR